VESKRRSSIVSHLGGRPGPEGCGNSFESCLVDPPRSGWTDSAARRVVDIVFSALLLTLLSVPMLIIAACVRLGSKGPAIFSQERVGLNGRPFRLFKFRSMVQRTRKDLGPDLTKDGDARVTPTGCFLRKLKLDELPQFYNVLRGDMSLVGPRPKLPQYSAIANMPYRPGITGPATLAFRREEEILSSVGPEQMEDFYMEHVKPVKARLDVCYMCKANPLSDLRIIMMTAIPPMLSHLKLPISLKENPSCEPDLPLDAQDLARQPALTCIKRSSEREPSFDSVDS
jgi:lipopolysaccharide/colanic/teichoic acid biosynthesis glycosyltransferase